MLKKNLHQPDERRDFKSHGHLDLVSLENGVSIGRAIFEPGWRRFHDSSGPRRLGRRKSKVRNARFHRF